MQELAFMLKLLGFVAATSWVLWIAGWFSVKRAGYWSAKRGLRGEGGKYEAWRPWLAVPVFGAGLAAVAWWGYGTVAPRAPIAEAAGLWNSFIALTLGALWWIGGICVVAAAPLAAVISAHKQSRAIRRRQLLKREAKNLHASGLSTIEKQSPHGGEKSSSAAMARGTAPLSGTEAARHVSGTFRVS